MRGAWALVCRFSAGAGGDDIGDLFVAIVHQEGGGFAILLKGERTRSDGLGGVPDELLVDMPQLVGEKLLNAEVTVVEENRVRHLRIANHFPIEDPPPQTIEVHRHHSVPLRPANRPVLGIIHHLPNASRRLDEGLVAVRVILRDKVVDGGILVKVVGCVSFAFGSGAVADVVVIVGNIVCGDELIADVVGILLVVLGGAATKENITSPQVP